VQWRPVTFNPGSQFVLGDFGMDFFGQFGFMLLIFVRD